MNREVYRRETESNQSKQYRHILSLAALFDGEFNIDWLQELTGEKASQIFAALDFGIKNKLISRNKSANFYFTDSVAQQKLIDLLSSDNKIATHRRIAMFLIDNLPEDPEKAKTVAVHLLHIINDLDGCKLLIETGDLYRRSSNDDQARTYYSKAIDDLRNLEGAGADLLFVEAAIQYAKVSADNTNPNQVIPTLIEAKQRAKPHGLKNYLGFLEMHLGKSEWLRSQYKPALRHFKKGWALASETDDPIIQRSAAIFGMFFNYWSGHYREVVQGYEAFVPEVENKFSTYKLPLLAALTAGVCVGHTGNYSQGLGMLHAIREHSRNMNNLSMAGAAGSSIGYLLLETHRPQEALQYVEDSMEEAIKAQNIYTRLGCLVLLCYAYHLNNDHERAASALQEYFDISAASQMTAKYSAIWMFICRAMEEGTFPRIEDISLEDEIRYSIDSGNLLMKGVAYHYKALLQRKRELPSCDVIQTLKRSVACLRTCGHQIELAKSKIELAREYLRLGDEEKALEWAEPSSKVLYGFNSELVPDDIRPLIKNMSYGENLLSEILRLSQELTTIHDYKDLSQRIISTINRITGAERGAIFLVKDRNRSDFMLRAAKNLTSEDISGPDFKASIKLIEETLRTGKGRIIALNDHNDHKPLDTNIIRSRICVPMTTRNKTVGVLYHDNRLFYSAFKESDLEILNYFAAQAAIAMDNAQAWTALNEMYEKQEIEKQHYENEYLETIHFEDFVGKSPAITKVFSQVEQVADTDASVLILGETGVGKELVARSIHRQSPRNGKPFIRVHCSALSESLISSELFGHEKGAFTGATARHMGRFELANGGTIFLDEIGDISMEIQVRLLRVLQSGEFERVGGHETLRSDFRLLAATNRDLNKEVEMGRFRQDLFYRLNVFPIHVPRLRERKEDIPLLAHYFLKLYANKFNKPVNAIPPHEMEKLLAYKWPGNVRELENVIERGVILSNKSLFRVPELWHTRTSPFLEKSFLTLEENERNHIISALQQTGGKVTGPGGAAELLNIHPNTLFSKMKKLGIQREARYHSLNP